MSETQTKPEEQKPLRSKEEVQAEYEMCSKHLGHKTYLMAIMGGECEKIKQRMYELNNEKLAEPKVEEAAAEAGLVE